MSERVFVLGAGRAGRGLFRAFRASGVDVVGLHGRRAESVPDPVTAGALPADIARADVILVAVRDGQLDEALAEIGSSRARPDAVVLHASGSAEPRGLAALRARGHPAGTFHPLVPIADPGRAAALFRGAWVGVDGDERAVDVATRLAARLGARTLRIPNGSKARYHAAAVLASNFPTVLAALATQLLAGTGIPETEGWAAIRSLMHGAVANLDSDAPARALTGPIVRGDVATIGRHLAAIPPGELRDVYVALARAAVGVARAAGAADASALDEIEELLAR
ncbi:MAG TPA: DUF2520 domain-containing protein [Gemmatimonadaceae bacterium]|nr:DUF2520 domain-containing protein [Gemmatimonadaceae bacterium]